MKRNIIVRFLTFVGLMASFSSCGEEEARYSVPWARVNLEINLVVDYELAAGGATKSYRNVNVPPGQRRGFGGILVMNSGAITNGTPVLHAYDLACPYEKQMAILVTPSGDGITAKCGTCGSVFEILSTGSRGSGFRKSGPAKNGLQVYNVVYSGSGSNFRVTN